MSVLELGTTRGRQISSISFGMTIAALVLVILRSASGQTIIKSSSFEGIWQCPGNTIVITHSDKGYAAKSFAVPDSHSSANQQQPTAKWQLWGIAPLVGKTLTYRISSPMHHVTGGANVRTSKLTLSKDGKSLDEASINQIIVSGRTVTTVTHPAVHYVRKR